MGSSHITSNSQYFDNSAKHDQKTYIYELNMSVKYYLNNDPHK